MIPNAGCRPPPPLLSCAATKILLRRRHPRGIRGRWGRGHSTFLVGALTGCTIGPANRIREPGPNCGARERAGPVALGRASLRLPYGVRVGPRGPSLYDRRPFRQPPLFCFFPLTPGLIWMTRTRVPVLSLPDTGPVVVVVTRASRSAPCGCGALLVTRSGVATSVHPCTTDAPA